jgi:hypothetical protein
MLTNTRPQNQGLKPICFLIMCNSGAPCYYAVSLRSAMRLGNEMYYTKEAWTSSGETISDAEAQK